MDSRHNQQHQQQQYRNYYRRADEEIDSNISYGSSNDEDPILTATITFDVTVDPNGQVISTSEGQIIAEGIHNPIDGRTLNLLEHNPIPLSHITAGHVIHGDHPTLTTVHQSLIQADSLSSMNSAAAAGASARPQGSGMGVGGGGLAGPSGVKDLTILQDSLDENESDSDESTSTSTESLIERSKRYMNQEAGIIILKRENPQSKNFNINLDFDLNNNSNNKRGPTTAATAHHLAHTNSLLRSDDLLSVDQHGAAKGFNINLDFDLDGTGAGPSGSSSNRANMLKKTGVDIDLMITSSTTTSRVENRGLGGGGGVVGNETFDELGAVNAVPNNLTSDIEYWRLANRDGPSRKTLDPNLIENENSWTTLHNNNNNNSNHLHHSNASNQSLPPPPPSLSHDMYTSKLVTDENTNPYKGR
jgi:hypothetical protein